MNRFWKLAVGYTLLLLALLICWSLAKDTSGDSSTALGLVFMAGFIFLATPLLVLLLGLAYGIARKAGFAAARRVLLYACLSLIAHLALAYDSGFFDKQIEKYKRDARAREFPALTQLQYVVASGPVSDIAKVRAALAAGADPNAGSYSDPNTPLLLLAAARADTETIAALLQAGANPDQRAVIAYDDIDTPAPLDLVLFSEYGDPRASMELLIAAGADPASSMLRTGACFLGDPQLYRQVSELGAPHKADKKQNSCLHHAAEQDRTALLQALLIESSEHAAGLRGLLTSANRAGQYPLDIAVARGNFSAALVIARAGGVASNPRTVERVMDNPSTEESLESLKMLLQQDQSPSSQGTLVQPRSAY